MNQTLEVCSVACRDAITMALHCQIKNKVFIWYETEDIWILIHITNVTRCNTELINKKKFVSAYCEISCDKKWMPILHLLRAKRCKTVTFCNARAPLLLVPRFVGRDYHSATSRERRPPEDGAHFKTARYWCSFVQWVLGVSRERPRRPPDVAKLTADPRALYFPPFSFDDDFRNF